MRELILLYVITRYPVSPIDKQSPPQRLAALDSPAFARGIKKLSSSLVRTIIPIAVFAVALASAQADTLTVVYTDAFSNTASLTLTGTSSGGVFHVTGVTGTFNGAAVVGLVPGFGGSDNFYTDPSVLPADTIDTGFEFETAGGAAIVNLYAYNYGGPGYATNVTIGGSTVSGAVFISSITSPPVTPAPTTSILALAGLAFIFTWRKFVVRRKLVA